MKKLIIACAAVLVLGLGLTTVGHVLGGQFYSVYYNGALHPFSDAAQNFSDKFVNISDHIVTADEDDDSDFDTDWVQDYLETRRNAIEGYSLPKQSLDHITSIDLTLKGGDFEILYVSGAGTDFTLDGDYSVATSSFTQNGKWTANIWANSGTVTLIIPRDSTSFREIDIACTQSANLFIEDNLSADSIKLSTQDGTLTTNGAVCTEHQPLHRHRKHFGIPAGIQSEPVPYTGAHKRRSGHAERYFSGAAQRGRQRHGAV